MLKKDQNKGFLALIPFLRIYKRELFLAFIALLVTAFAILFFGKIIKYLIDYGFVQRDLFSLNLILLLFIAVVVIMAVAGYYRSFLINQVSEKIIFSLRKKAFEHVISVSSEFFEFTKTSDVVSRLMTDTVVLYNVMSNTISFLLRNILFFIGGLAFLIFTSPKLSLLSFISILIAISPVIFLGKKLKQLSSQSQSALVLIGSRLEEALNGIKTIQAYLCEKKEAQNFSVLLDNSLKISLEKISKKSLMVALVIALSFGGIAVVLWVGGLEVLNGKITSGDLSAFIFYSVITATSLVSLSQIMEQLQSASDACGRIFQLLEVESPVKEKTTNQNLSNANLEGIKFSQVNFSYPSRKENNILKDFNLEIKPQEKIAIAGLSGSGKSTIFQLLLRFYDVDSGKITLNNNDIRELSFADLRRNFSYISQDCFIFSGTVFENISYVNKEVSEAQVAKIIADNEALHFINDLPQKMHSFVGEKGVKLSGGQRQRIAIARAILKDSPILLLDEATSALDNQNEKIIAKAIADFAKEKTVITVAHRLSTIVNADRIIFIKDGEIAEIGSHQELIKLGGFYKKMYEAEPFM